MKTSRDVVRESFLAGYNAVKNGSINNELTPAEIEAKYPRYSSRAFAEGMLDALHMDSYRYFGAYEHPHFEISGNGTSEWKTF